MPANPFGGGNSTGDGTAATVTSFPSFDTHMKMILITIFRISKEENSNLCEALREGGLHEWPTFLDTLIEPDFARELTYTHCGLPTHIHRSIQWTIEALAEFSNDLRKNEKNWKDVMSYTYEGFRTFRMACALRLQNESVLNPPAPPPGTNKKSPQQNSGARQVFARLCKKVQTLRKDPETVRKNPTGTVSKDGGTVASSLAEEENEDDNYIDPVLMQLLGQLEEV
eukprot:jgi/Psemu1/20644/gm1.20644_g